MVIFSCKKEKVFDDSNSQYENTLNQHFSNYEIVKIDYDRLFKIAKSTPTNYIEINFELEDHPELKFMMKDDHFSEMFAHDYEQIILNQDGSQTIVPMAEMYAMTGYNPGSKDLVAMTLGLGQLECYFNQGEEEMAIEALINFDPNAPSDMYVLYNTKDVKHDYDAGCTEEGKVNNTTDQSGSMNKASSIKRGYITILGDYQLYKKFYNTKKAFRYMSVTTYYANRRFYAYSGINFSNIIRISYLYNFSAAKNYPPKTTSNSSTFLKEWATFYKYSWYKEGDLNYLFTGHNVSGLVGKAYVGKLCRAPSKAFGFGEYYPQGSIANTLMAHELGHIMGLHHTKGVYNIMNPWVSGYSN